ncbi:MAG: hypothetical protein R3330_11190 [Saprospiraceae bacterium]|nr:hypothetical protein [Saprospiraceae bacterium]
MLRGVLSVLLLSVIISMADAQSRRPQRDAPEFGERIWFGVDVNDLRFGNGTFTFGLTPMAAIEVAENVSLGLMLKADYYYEKYRFTVPRIKFESIDFGPGVFARFDVLNQFLAHIEYEYAYLERAQTDNAGLPIIDQVNNVVLTERIEQSYVYVGAGYSSGSNVQYTISIHYNILDDFDYVRFPWDYRFGVRWYLR